MKNLFLSLAFMLIGLFASANSNPKVNDGISKISKFEISNLEIFMPENGVFSKTRYKKNNCKDGSYSFFVPFYEQKDLVTTTVTSSKLNKDILLNYKSEKGMGEALITDIIVSEDKTKVTFNVKKQNLIFPSTLTGVNLSEDYIYDLLSNLDDKALFYTEDCPACAVLVAVIIGDACEDARHACDGCTGSLTVGPCWCSCSQMKG